MRIGIIDFGTNTLRLNIFETPLAFHRVLEQQLAVRLGKGHRDRVRPPRRRQSSDPSLPTPGSAMREGSSPPAASLRMHTSQ